MKVLLPKRRQQRDVLFHVVVEPCTDVAAELPAAIVRLPQIVLAPEVQVALPRASCTEGALKLVRVLHDAKDEVFPKVEKLCASPLHHRGHACRRKGGSSTAHHGKYSKAKI